MLGVEVARGENIAVILLEAVGEFSKGKNGIDSSYSRESLDCPSHFLYFVSFILYLNQQIFV